MRKKIVDLHPTSSADSQESDPGLEGRDFVVRKMRFHEIDDSISGLSTYAEIDAVRIEAIEMLSIVLDSTKAIEQQLQEAKASAYQTGVRADEVWFHAATFALRKRKAEARQLQGLLTKISIQRKGLHQANHPPRVDVDLSSFGPPGDENEARRQRTRALFVIAQWVHSIRGIANLPSSVLDALDLIDRSSPGWSDASKRKVIPVSSEET